MGKPRKFRSPKQLEEAWKNYKADCDNRFVMVHEFSSRNSEFVSAELKRTVTYTIEGFCRWVGLPRQDFYSTYDSDERYRDIVTRIREECEVDAREKFELGEIPPQLAGLWMSKYGYTTRQDANISGSLETEKNKLDDLIRQMRGGDDSS